MRAVRAFSLWKSWADILVESGSVDDALGEREFLRNVWSISSWLEIEKRMIEPNTQEAAEANDESAEQQRLFTKEA